ncbi:Ribosomal protein L32p [Acididesulfobacillus acetoxydans]|uniref:Large ribosomal subunit protein bL32 n=1 Tax=Acididesulfobacillus acetoxydans TaxID=1561005 RepID=A0A8S0VY83_9FIRM|nr:50S ribosomal protein L32 [Acididesulfobacillus acetoxydans]KLU61049.1 50S ribosomal protein L32 [Peptococcaceae bacterium CEB3]CAA7602733.1 Ribosomal protein L32p [Acididesulfobacillus acetoxydans]CEJ06410.1 rpmF_bact: ribosomal protein L32 [Acididesulfobacillus acetoxydans]
MGVAQHRQSKARVRKRRAMWKLSAPNITECPQCHKLKLAHHVCPACGYYKSKKVLTVSE